MDHMRQLALIIDALPRIGKIGALELVSLGTSGALLAVSQARKWNAHGSVGVHMDMGVAAVVLRAAAFLEVGTVRRAVRGRFVR